MYIYGIPFLYLLCNWKLISKKTKRQRVIMAMAVFLIILAYVYPIVHGTHDYSYIKVAFFIFRKLIIYLFLACMIVKEYKERASFEHFIYYYAITHAIYVIGTLLLVFIPGLKQFWFDIFMDQTGNSTIYESFGYTFRIGWQGFSGYRLTLHCTFCCIFLFYLYFVGGKTLHLNFRQFVPVYILCFLGNMFYGRSGLVVSGLASLTGLFVWNRRHFRNVMMFTFIIVLSLIILYSMRNISFISDWYSWAMDPITNLLKYGSFHSPSVNSLNKMVFMPDWKTILLGDGYFTYDGHYYMSTDSGLMRNILFWGIIGMIFSYGMTIYSIMDLKKKNGLLCFLMLITFALFEYKGDVYYEFVALLLSASFVESIRNKHYVGVTSILKRKYIWRIT